MRVFPWIGCLALIALAACAPPAADRHPVEWRAWLDSPGGELPFGLELRQGATGFEAVLVNGSERIPVERVERDGTRWTLGIDHYDSSIEALLAEDGQRLDGRWEKTGVGGSKTGLDFHAVAGDLPRFEPDGPLDAAALSRLDGRWAVDFAESDEPAVGLFEAAADGRVEGTFLTTTGDYRFLAGTLHGERLRLSCFDGAHAFLFEARLAEDGTLAGDFWSRDSWHETWTARKDPAAALPDAFGLTTWVGGTPLDELVFPDLDGTERSLNDEAFVGRARVIEIFGSWCPNCNDASRLLVELDRKYRERGLAIVGLAFEMTGELERDARQLRRYAEHHGIDFPLLVGGISDKAEASQAFPLLDRIRSYPTTVFLHADGRVRAVYQGFVGPATGAAHEEMRDRFETLIQELLMEGDS